ncbi:dihydrolipoyl dehydrogenase [Paenalkalicoccus suaedae]|uniref:Dihydrolipoyl dehydrogenase n=1 Tax=Paenalkalicoccus suaedae TaxID=2592382 RepID=A0A859FHZ1_9BACI|nr:dihydrolipoyl dehydrogenase [Paenalkalicoccus suaedae]QKS72458.1 dihydrolipoyl dehydrogenase [Paenalkalicoccus suaedae]
MHEQDVIVIGGGPGGYVAAIRASSFGQRVTLFEAEKLGGTCLNTGCIPSKTLLRHTEVLYELAHAAAFGIHVGKPEIDWSVMQKRQEDVVKTLRNGVQHLLKKSGVNVIRERAVVTGKDGDTHTVEAAGETFKAKSIILAMGSTPVIPPIPGLGDYDTSDTIFSLQELPASMTIVGGGIIGIEFATIFSSLGVDITVVELGPRIMPTEDPDASELMAKLLTERGVRIVTETSVTRVDGQTVHLSDNTTVTAERLLLATGRKPNTSAVADLGLEMTGTAIQTNTFLETSVEGIYAIGDLNGTVPLAHTASAEGLIAANNASGRTKEQIDYDQVPRCVYTLPEIASVGITVEEAERRGMSVRAVKTPIRSNGKALAAGITEGFVKLIAEETYGEIVGVVIVAPHATDMISEATAYMQLEGTVTELAKLVHPHPTLSESIFEAANSFLHLGIHH